MFSRRSIKPLALALAAALIFFGSVPVHGNTFDRVVAKVNGEIITLSAVEDRVGILMDQMKSMENPSIPPEEEMMEKALDIMITEKLQIQDGEKRGFKVGEESVLKFLDDIKAKNRLTDENLEAMLVREGRSLESYKGHIRNQIMVSKVMKFHMGGPVKVSKREIKKYYDKHVKDYWVPPKIHARHILLIIDDTLTPRQKRLKEIKAREILKQIRAGKDFTELAKKYSEDVSASEGGDIGIVEKGKMVPEFDQAVYQLSPGEVSGVVKTRYGLHIIKNERILQGRTRALEEVKDGIENSLGFEKKKKKYEDWVAEMKKSAYVETFLIEKQTGKKLTNRRENKRKTGFADKKSRRGKIKTRTKLDREEVEFSANVPKRKLSRKNAGAGDSGFDALERKLKHYKKLRDDKKITEREYQKKKMELLNRL